MFSSTEILPNTQLNKNKPISQKFLRKGINSFKEAVKYVHCLRYGRNSNRTETLLVLDEGKGTCSSKHALLASLAKECSIPLDLMLGIYAMDGSNTPGVEIVLNKYGLESIPEAHCYLKYQKQRVDITRSGVKVMNPITNFLFEKVINPEDISFKKVKIHQDFIKRWLVTSSASLIKYNFDTLWNIREECISVL